MLYLVPTPIGNLEDITLRSMRVLKEVDLILAEDTRTSKKLMLHYEIDTPMRSYHAHNEHKVLEGIISELQTGKTLALITDAGTPGISDPGFLLTRACVQNGIKVECLPGANALIPALASSGIPTDKFFFEGFLPHKKGRKTRLEYLSDLPYSFAFYESPHRLIKSLDGLIETCGPARLACVCRELTKIYEEKITDTLINLSTEFKKRASIKGEIVVIVQGKVKNT